jgi:hypothetical protein
MANEFVELFERTFVEEKVDAFARRELSGFVFAFSAFGTATRFGFGAEAAEIVHPVFVFRSSS